MSQWIVRNIVLSVLLWAIFGFVLIASAEVLVFGRFEPIQYLGGAVGLGIGFTVAMPVLPLRSRDT
ncbi:hypothetical protein [Natronorubrum sp. FCH18a]|uniref:hypothetical protein n=1 Tax=Natronorubrum sp. FCH18a TaxID=3447018 RepID=UPI003F511CEB